VNIVVGLTERPESRAALDVAVEEARLRGAQLHIVRTVATEVGESFARIRSWESDVSEIEEQGRALVADLRERGVNASFRVEPVSADPADVLLEAAREVEADLLVIGMRRRSAVGKLVLGSVAQDVLMGAECDVLAVHAGDEK
jgi:nucleotide-binding universal stress UspA family protein